jgi:hypothetical protein
MDIGSEGVSPGDTLSPQFEDLRGFLLERHDHRWILAYTIHTRKCHLSQFYNHLLQALFNRLQIYHHPPAPPYL